MAGLYFHIPFCRSRCAYCDFFSTTREHESAAYVAALRRELVCRRSELAGVRVHSIYIGGGTPSVLSPTLLGQLLDDACAYYDVADDAEVTMEMNPDDVARQLPFLCRRLAGEGKADKRGDGSDDGSAVGTASALAVNRLSLGVQTFDDALLSLIRRRHDSEGAIHAVKKLQAAGFRNISIDLIYGLPGQTMAQWEHDLDIAFGLGVQHLSAYALSYESGTLLTRWRDEGRIQEVEDSLSVDMYRCLCQRAREAGFEHYEISNFALPNYASRHNSSYWDGTPYLGFGPAAHSYDGRRTRRANSPDLDAYIKQCAADGNMAETEHLSDAALYDEAVMCGLRTARGIDLSLMSHRFGAERRAYLLRQADRHLAAHHLVIADGHLRLTEAAIMISDDIMSDLMAAE